MKLLSRILGGHLWDTGWEGKSILLRDEQAAWVGYSWWAGCLSRLLRVSGLLERAAQGERAA